VEALDALEYALSAAECRIDEYDGSRRGERYEMKCDGPWKQWFIAKREIARLRKAVGVSSP
jgi:hypothetical protein